MMRANRALCDTPTWEGCTVTADYGFVCNVEGVQRHQCNNCKNRWRERARQDPVLAARCPICSEKLPVRPLPRPQTDYSGLLGSYMAVAFDEAMRRAGILAPVRAQVLQIADTQMDIWAAAEVQSGQALDASA